ncbi:Hypothetical protein HVR_LOCUS414 [uncultured virus]|nr:Hypothetical protein HVR_LOCUS414 [uncultured virus]
MEHCSGNGGECKAPIYHKYGGGFGFCDAHCKMVCRESYDRTSNHCAWGKDSCWADREKPHNLCKIHWAEFEKDPFSVPKGTTVIAHITEARTVEINNDGIF